MTADPGAAEPAILYDRAMWLNQRTVDAIRIMAQLAEAGGSDAATGRSPLVKAGLLAARTSITPLNVQKTANILVQAGLIESVRGPRGGLRLARPPGAISVAEIARAFEPRDCPVSFLAPGAAEVRLSRAIFEAHRAFFRPLEAVTLADLASAGGSAALARAREVSGG